MKTKAPTSAKKQDDTTSPKGKPVPVRFDEDDRKLINLLALRTGLPMADIIRRAFRFAGPKFRSGEVNIGDLTQAAK